MESFRRWSEDEAYPEHGRVAYLRGEVFIDIGKVQLFAHNQLKHEITLVLAGIIRAECLGRFFPDGAFLSNQAADVSNQPDGMFVSTEAIRAGRVRIVEGRASGHVELEGSPEMVLEVVSTSSVEKDTVVLRDAYFVAGVQEYWLVDARTEPLRFDLLRRGKNGFVATRKRQGWTRSAVFGHDFRLLRSEGADGFPAFTLESRPVESN